MPIHFRRLLAGIALGVAGIAADAEVVVVVSSTSPVTTLSVEQIADIFLGRSNQFPGGGRAVPIDQAESSADRTEFYARFSGRTPAQMKMHWSKLIFTGRGRPPAQVKDSSAVKELLSSNLEAISYIDRSTVDESVTVLDY